MTRAPRSELMTQSLALSSIVSSRKLRTHRLPADLSKNVVARCTVDVCRGLGISSLRTKLSAEFFSSLSLPNICPIYIFFSFFVFEGLHIPHEYRYDIGILICWLRVPFVKQLFFDERILYKNNGASIRPRTNTLSKTWKSIRSRTNTTSKTWGEPTDECPLKEHAKVLVLTNTVSKAWGKQSSVDVIPKIK